MSRLSESLDYYILQHGNKYATPSRLLSSMHYTEDSFIMGEPTEENHPIANALASYILGTRGSDAEGLTYKDGALHFEGKEYKLPLWVLDFDMKFKDFHSVKQENKRHTAERKRYLNTRELRSLLNECV